MQRSRAQPTGFNLCIGLIVSVQHFINLAYKIQTVFKYKSREEDFFGNNSLKHYPFFQPCFSDALCIFFNHL